MQEYAPFLDRIDERKGHMIDLVCRLSAINSGSYNRDGIAQVREEVAKLAAPLGGKREACDTLLLRKRPEAPFQVLLCGHLDTVYGKEDPFQNCEQIGGDRLHGPGVADMKGGLVVAMEALAAFESSPFARNVGWTFLCTEDEEIGSPSSEPLLRSEARRADIALVYEPSLPDGSLAGERKGSANYRLTIRGRSAHVGRNPELGVNAISKMAALFQELEQIEGLNVGAIEGGGPLNRVPDHCSCGLNLRTMDLDRGRAAIEEISKRHGAQTELLSSRPPKPFEKATKRLFEEVRACGDLLGQEIRWRPTGGVCDGNFIADEGTPTCDTLGVRGEHIHSDQEILWIESLTQRAKLSFLLLTKVS